MVPGVLHHCQHPARVEKCRAMVRRDALARLAVAGRGRLSAPKAPKVARVGAAGVTLRWSAPKRGKPAAYQILRNGRLIGRTTHRTFTDRKVKPGHTYRYAVRGVDAHGRRGLLSHSVRVSVPLKRIPGPPGSAGPTPRDRAGPAGSRPGSDHRSADRGAGRAPVLARRLRPDGRAARVLDRPRSRRARRLVPEHGPARPTRAPEAAHVGQRRHRPAGLRRRPGHRVARRDAARRQPAARAARVLLAPPLGGQHRRRDPEPVAAHLPRPHAQLRRLPAQPRADVPDRRVRDVDQRRRDDDVPQRQPEPQGRAERELRARVHGAVQPRPDRA